MERTKRRTCLVAFAIIVAGATHLARAAEAAPPPLPPQCSDAQRLYAEGYADGFCVGSGEGRNGVLDSCESDGNGGFHYTWHCE
ncbi:MAG TPA: hypothetical protein VNP72_10160 [Longimicrobium sp.]|nr:hypothetical protein [Longimicrobium sp.]